MLVYALVTGSEVYDYQDTVDGVHLPDVDAIVVLAGGRGRIAVAGDLWYRYRELAKLTPVAGAPASSPPKSPVLYISGMGRQSNWSSLDRQIRRGVLQVMAPSDVILERESSNTEENARFLEVNVRDRGWKKVLLVTSSYHMKRALMIFDQVFLALGTPIQIETLSVYQDPYEPDEWRTQLQGLRVTLVEYFKLIFYRNFWRPEPHRI